MRKTIFAVIVGVLALTVGCSGRDERADVVRLDRIVTQFPGMTAEDRTVTLRNVEIPMGDYLYMMGLQSADLEGSVDTLAMSAAYKVFYPAVETRYRSVDTLSRQLGRVNAGLSRIFPDLSVPEYFAVISPYRQPVMLVDSLVFISLNHYLGAGYEGYEGMDNYIRKMKEPERIPFDVAEAVIAVSNPYAPESEYPMAFSRMLYEGALLNAVGETTGERDVMKLMGYDDSEIGWLADNETRAWNRIVGDQLLFSTDPLDADRLCRPSPATSVISPDAPGRIGRYFGYRIVRSYLDRHPDATFADLLSPSFYDNQRSLVEASFVPGK